MKLESCNPNPTKAQQHAAVRAARGVLPRKPDGPSFAERWAEYKAEEWALEQRREDLLAGMMKKMPPAGDSLRLRLP